MRLTCLLLLLFTLSCKPGELAPESGLAEGEATEGTYILGFRGGWGTETYFRYRSGQWYRSAYAGLRSNESTNKLNRDALATDERNWELIGPAPAEVSELIDGLPTPAFSGIEDRSDCPALAYDGGCAYVGIYEGGEYSEWFGDFTDVPEVADYMKRVNALVRKVSEN